MLIVKMMLSMLAWTIYALPVRSDAGCYELPKDLKAKSIYTYQSQGWCQSQCFNSHFYGISDGDKCFCLTSLPEKSADREKCNHPCPGYPSNNCGGLGYIYVYGDLPSSSSSSITSTRKSSSTSSYSEPTNSPTSDDNATQSADKKGKGHSDNKSSEHNSKKSGLRPGAAAGIAVVVVVVVLVICIVAYLLWKKKKGLFSARNDSDSINSEKSQKVTSLTNGPRLVDPRLDKSMIESMASSPEHRVSLSDDQDYTRRIFHVTNPDIN